MQYPVVLHTDDGISYGVTVPDLPGCFSGGDTLDDALHCVLEAINGHLELMVEGGNAIPQASTVAKHRANPDYADGVWAVVSVDTSRFEGRTEKINVTVPSLVLARIDSYARAHGMTRSGFLTEAARAAMVR